MPKVIFKKMSLEDNINFIKEIINDKDSILDIYTYTINLFPELKDISLDDSKEAIDKKIRDVVTKQYNSLINLMETFKDILMLGVNIMIYFLKNLLSI